MALCSSTKRELFETVLFFISSQFSVCRQSSPGGGALYAQFALYAHFLIVVVGTIKAISYGKGGEALYKAWEQDVIDLRAQGLSWMQTAQEIRRRYGMQGLTDMTLVRKCRVVFEKINRHAAGQATAEPAGMPKESKRYNQDGTVESVCLIELWDGEDLTPEKILAFHKLDSEKWTVVSYTNNVWHAMMGKDHNNDRKQMYQSKVVAKPKVAGLSFADIDNYFKSKDFTFTKPIISPLQYDPSGEVLEICLPDLHSGLLAWAQETGADYDIHIARDALLRCINDIADRCKGKSFKKIYFATLGDLMHIDNDAQTTSKGTFQQADGRVAKIFDYTLDMLIESVDILAAIAPVEVVYLSGNHDRNLGYTLIKALQMAYRKQTDIVFDVCPNPMKHRLIGCALVGWTHGDMQAKNLGTWLPERARQEYGLARFVEVHAGHNHNENTKENYVLKAVENSTVYQAAGVVVRHLPRISNSSWWEHQQGYPVGQRTMMCFIWNEHTGLRTTWYSSL